MERLAEVTRKTRETEITVKIDLDGAGEVTSQTGVPFLDHMLAQVAVHGLLNLTVLAQGDLEIDDHHTVEDVGIVLGQALRQALGRGFGITRFGTALIPMDEALVQVALDLSGRPFLAYDMPLDQPLIGRFDGQLIEEFLRAFATHAQVTLHVHLLSGHNAHHCLEATFKALGRALAQAAAPDPRRNGIPSSKGLL